MQAHMVLKIIQWPRPWRVIQTKKLLLYVFSTVSCQYLTLAIVLLQLQFLTSFHVDALSLFFCFSQCFPMTSLVVFSITHINVDFLIVTLYLNQAT